MRSVQINAMETVFNSQGYISEVNRYNEEGKLLSKEIRNYQQSGALSELPFMLWTAGWTTEPFMSTMSGVCGRESVPWMPVIS